MRQVWGDGIYFEVDENSENRNTIRRYLINMRIKGRLACVGGRKGGGGVS